jgi:hypothetical protein
MSINDAVFHSDNEIFLDIFIIENSTVKKNISDDLYECLNKKINIKTIFSDNNGYFPSIQNAIKKIGLNLLNYKYTIVSNVDLEIDVQFFSRLKSLRLNKSTGVIAPNIISKISGVKKNPKIKKRPSRIKLYINKILFYSPLTYIILNYFHSLRKRRSKYSKIAELFDQEAYAAHGAFMIFTTTFFQKNELKYPIFLFGEEIYVAEVCRCSGLRTLFVSNIIVYDHGGASTSKIKSSEYCEKNSEALSYLLNKYF